MNTKNIKIFLVIIFSVIFLNGCATGPMSKGKSKGFKHNTPLIKEDVKKTGKIEVEKTVDSLAVMKEGEKIYDQSLEGFKKMAEQNNTSAENQFFDFFDKEKSFD